MFEQIFHAYEKTTFAEEVKCLFSQKNSYFVSGEVKLFSKNKDKFVGFWHPDYLYKGKPYVCFGYWSFYDQEDFVHSVDKLKVWARSKGIDQILGPIDFSTLHNYRLPMKSYDQKFMGEPQGDFSQAKAVESLGFKNIQKYSSYYIEDPSKIYSWGQKRSQKVLKQGLEFKALSFKDINFKKRKHEVYNLIDEVFKKNLGYLKPSELELEYLYHEKKLESLSRFPFFFVEDGEGKLVGLFVSFVGPNVFSGGTDMCLYFKTIGAAPSKSLHNPVFFFLIHEIYRTYEQMNMKIPICFSLMREGNVAEKVARMFSDQSRSYALYRLSY